MLSSPLLCPGPEKQSLPMAADMGQERLCPARGSWGLDKVQIQFRKLVPDAQSAPDPGLAGFFAGMRGSDVVPDCRELPFGGRVRETLSNDSLSSWLASTGSKDWPC